MSLFLVISHLKIHNANALSSPYTIGFPAMTAWFGGIHALQRKLSAQFSAFQLTFSRATVACHQLNLQTYKGQGDYVHSIIGTGNPLDKTGSRPSFIEEARCHLEVSLAIECEIKDAEDGRSIMDEKAAFLSAIAAELQRMKWAGGDVLAFKKPYFMNVDGNKETKKLTRQLMPSYVLKERRDLMIEAMEAQSEKGEKVDAIDALLDYLAVHYRCEPVEPSENLEGLESAHFEWTKKRKAKGWIVPIATGFHGISELGKAENQRDADTPHRFAESLVTLGEFKMPYQIKRLNDLLWHSHYDEENNFYLIQQKTYN